MLFGEISGNFSYSERRAILLVVGTMNSDSRGILLENNNHVALMFLNVMELIDCLQEYTLKMGAYVTIVSDAGNWETYKAGVLKDKILNLYIYAD